MVAYANYKTKSATLLIEHSINLEWSAEAEEVKEEVKEETLSSLWDSLTADEKRDLAFWLETQSGFKLY